jgi:hypothetical protein
LKTQFQGFREYGTFLPETSIIPREGKWVCCWQMILEGDRRCGIYKAHVVRQRQILIRCMGLKCECMDKKRHTEGKSQMLHDSTFNIVLPLPR